ncbi:hypothetical protein B0T16DRAFT_405510 [Cercophora newfieldiana]|uniref:Uncharacterized protein n=1 Tax=Cercophora newfieldiana TaxID=92897 RepID=A0AA40CVH2_9PEZI|nr:hypothetical protein B0T16DRAFT_405510 [Cercophora newfieldiana]
MRRGFLGAAACWDGHPDGNPPLLIFIIFAMPCHAVLASPLPIQRQQQQLLLHLGLDEEHSLSLVATHLLHFSILGLVATVVIYLSPTLCRTLIDLRAGVARGAEPSAIGRLFSAHFRLQGATAAGAVQRHRSARDGDGGGGASRRQGPPGDAGNRQWWWLFGGLRTVHSRVVYECPNQECAVLVYLLAGSERGGGRGRAYLHLPWLARGRGNSGPHTCNTHLQLLCFVH